MTLFRCICQYFSRLFFQVRLLHSGFTCAFRSWMGETWWNEAWRLGAPSCGYPNFAEPRFGFWSSNDSILIQRGTMSKNSFFLYSKWWITHFDEMPYVSIFVKGHRTCADPSNWEHDQKKCMTVHSLSGDLKAVSTVPWQSGCFEELQYFL